MSDHLGKTADDYMREFASRMFASNDAPPAVFPARPLEEWEKTTGTIGGPDRSADLLAKMKKMIAEVNKNTSPVLPTDKVAMGREAIEELARLTQRKGYHTPGPHATDPMGVITGIQIVESEVLDPDQWIAYDRNGRILAMGRSGSVKILVGSDPT